MVGLNRFPERPNTWNLGWWLSLCLAVFVTACSSSSSSTTPPLPAGFIATDSTVQLSSSPATLTVQFLHASDWEANVAAIQDAPNFSAVLAALREDYPNTLTLSSGDNFIPSPFYNASADSSLSDFYNRTPGKADIQILNALGIQASAIGNHEFDQGPRQLRDLIRSDSDRGYTGTLFPYLSANLTFNSGGDLSSSDLAEPGQEASSIANKIAPSAILTVGGQTIGLVGTTTTRLASISSPGSFISVNGSVDATSDKVSASAIQSTIDALVTSGVNKIVLLAHLQQLENEVALAGQLSGVDIIIGGGSHRVVAKGSDPLRSGDERTGDYPILRRSLTGEPIAIVNTGANYRYVGRLVVGFDANGVLAAVDPVSGAYATDGTGVSAVGGSPIPEVVNAVQPIANLIITKDSAPFYGRTALFLNGLRAEVRTRETNWGNITADANLTYAKTVDPSVVISLKNGGGIRSPIGTVSSGNSGERLPPAANPQTGKAEGDISRLDIESSLAFNNTLSLVSVTATQLKEVMENGVSQTASGVTPGAFPQIGGMAFSFDPSRQPLEKDAEGNIVFSGDRVRSLRVDTAAGADIVVQNGAVVGDPNRTFRLVTLNFLAGGGDGYPFPLYDATALNRVDLVADGTPIDFFTAGSEQNAASAFLAGLGEVTEINYPDRPATESLRVQDLSVRADTVLN